MNTSNTIQIVSFLAATLITVAINGSMLLKMDDMAQQATVAQTSPTLVTLDTVTIVARRG
ncbi:MAG: hypothetical protein H7Y28_09570 [Rhodoferax sp.]|nr:hypothetical protein [Rhodoferax sp.]